MGTGANDSSKGLIPRICDRLFEKMRGKEEPVRSATFNIYSFTSSLFQFDDLKITFKVEVAYMEIYNEKVRELLDPEGLAPPTN